MKKNFIWIFLCCAAFIASPLFAQNKGKMARSVKSALGAKTPRAAGVSVPKKALYVTEEQIASARQMMIAAERNRPPLPAAPALSARSSAWSGLYERVRKSTAGLLLEKEPIRLQALNNRLKDSPLRPYDGLVSGRNLVFVSGSAQEGVWNEVRQVAASASRAKRPVVLASFHPFFSKGGLVPGKSFFAQMSLLGMKEWLQFSVEPSRPLWEQADVWNRELGEKLITLGPDANPVVIVFGPSAWMEGENGFKLAGLLKGKSFPSSKDVAIISVQTGPAVTRTAHNWNKLGLVKPEETSYDSDDTLLPSRFRVDGHYALWLGSHAVVYTRPSYSGEF